MTSRSLPELVGLALACGAAEIGGPLSKGEIQVAKHASTFSQRNISKVRSAIRHGEDPLGDAFCAIRSPLERRDLGAFYTSRTILEPMLDWTLAQEPKRFVDPGSGSGRFAVAAAMSRPRLDIVAIDIDPVATMLTRAALACIGKKTEVRVLHADYLTAVLPSIDGRTAFVGNPPYVRHHDLDANTKGLAALLAMRVGHTVSGLAGLHALFYLATLALHARVGDVGSFVTSAEWMDVGYGSVIRKMFSNGLGGRSLTVYAPESVPFTDAMTTAAITTFKIGEEPNAARIARIIHTNTKLELESVGREIDRVTLSQAERWSPFLREPEAEYGGRTIGTMFRVSRGQVTGSNAFFVMTRRDARERGVERFCVPIITSADEIFNSRGLLRDAPERKVGLEVPKDINLGRYRRLAAYIASGEACGVHLGYVASHRSPWWAITFPKPPIVATYMARQAPLFAANPDGLGLINVAHGLYPRLPIARRLVRRVVATLNANRSKFVGHGRTYHGGLEKFEPKEMEALPLVVEA